MTSSQTTTACTACSKSTDSGHFLALGVRIDLHVGLQYCHQQSPSQTVVVVVVVVVERTD